MLPAIPRPDPRALGHRHSGCTADAAPAGRAGADPRGDAGPTDSPPTGRISGTVKLKTREGNRPAEGAVVYVEGADPGPAAAASGGATILLPARA